MKQVVIRGRCWVNYEKVIDMADDEAEEFIQNFHDNPDIVYSQIDEEDLQDIECVDDGEIICK